MIHELFTKTFYPTLLGWRPWEVHYWILKKEYTSQFCEKIDNCGSEIRQWPLKQVFGQSAPEPASETISKYLKKVYCGLIKV